MIYLSVLPSRKPCKRSHDIRCPHNRAVLQDCTLQDLPERELFLLLLQNDPSLLPEVRGAREDGQPPSRGEPNLPQHPKRGSLKASSLGSCAKPVLDKFRFPAECSGFCSPDILL